MATSKRKVPKAQPDWEAIERDYRAGRLSIREVARQHGVSDTAIRIRAKAANWTRDLSSQVLAEAKARAVRGDLRVSPDRELSDAETVAAAAAETAEVMRRHRSDLAKLRDLEDKLIGEFEVERDRDTEVDIVGRSKVLKAIADTRCKRIELERKAWCLDEPVPGSTPQAPQYVAWLPAPAPSTEAWSEMVAAGQS